MSAKIYRFPKVRRWRPAPPRPPAPAPYCVRQREWVHASGFGLLLSLTLPAAFLYLSGAVDVGRHDTLYAALLAAVWGFYFLHPPLLRVRVLGPLLIVAGRLLLLATVIGFFGGIYWIILRNG